jgi:predicted transcriptional regulator
MDSTPLVQEHMIEMTTSIRPEMDAYEAMDLLVRKKTTGLPVIDAEDRLVGFLTEKDCLRLIAISHQYNMTGRRVQDIMSGITQALRPDDNMLTAAMAFLSTNFAHLPVMEADRLVGSLSRQNALSAIVEYYLGRGRMYTNGKVEQAMYDHPSSIEQLQSLAKATNREQMASVLHGRHTDS